MSGRFKSIKDEPEYKKWSEFLVLFFDMIDLETLKWRFLLSAGYLDQDEDIFNLMQIMREIVRDIMQEKKNNG